VLIVTGLRALAGAAPSGEWELHLSWPTGSMARASGEDDAHIRGGNIAVLGVVRRVFMKARDMATATVRWWDGCC
jgi:hypothetical protein